MQPTLDSFLPSSSSTIPRIPLATSRPIHDRSSTFSAAIYRASSPSTALSLLATHSRSHPTPPTHSIAAWRCMLLRANHTGLSGPSDFELRTGSQDDGEKGGGKTILRAMEAEGVVDALVVVSRWYGGVMLGPVRFTHIESCAREVGRKFREIEEAEEGVEELRTLDGVLEGLRAELRAMTGGASGDKKQEPDYAALIGTNDLPRIRRLVRAREKAVQGVRKLVDAKKAAGGSADK